MSSWPHTGVLIVNLGTPDSYSTADVRKYLREFLSDKWVLDINPIVRFLLVNLIIAPFRAPKSSKNYQKLWTANGSPLKHYGYSIQDMLQMQLGAGYEVQLGMRYKNPSIKEALQKLMAKKVKKILVIPLFPQYASATTGTVIDEVQRQISKYWLIPELHIISNYYDNAAMLSCYANNAKTYLAQVQYDHILISFHGIPQRHILKGSTGYCKLGNCCDAISAQNHFCYRAQCYATARGIANELQLSQNQYTVVFQSRLGKEPWLEPYAEDTIKRLPGMGYKNVLVLAPSFTADCLETTMEIGDEYLHLFKANGGTHLQLVHSLNDSPEWVKVLKEMVLKY
ncbi:MAG: ferrochelatase [Cytophagales bacterium]|nr:ferrochelatase [Cytophagales bacterium]